MEWGRRGTHEARVLNRFCGANNVLSLLASKGSKGENLKNDAASRPTTHQWYTANRTRELNSLHWPWFGLWGVDCFLDACNVRGSNV